MSIVSNLGWAGSAAYGGGSVVVPNPSWFADWSSVTTPPSTVLADTQDNGKFNDVSSSGSTLLTVVTRSSTGLSFPSGMSNLLRIDGNAAIGRKVENTNTIGTLWANTAVGNYMFMRYYFCSVLPDANGGTINYGNPHYTEVHPGNLTYFWKQYDPTQSDGNLTPGSGQYIYAFGHDWPSNQGYYSFTSAFLTNTVYRFECRFLHDTSTTFVPAIRCYVGDSGTLFQDSTNTFETLSSPSGGGVHGNTLAQDVAVTSWNLDDTGTNTFQQNDVGQPGQAGSNWSGPGNGNYVYVGGMALWANQSNANLWGSSPGANLIYHSGTG